MQNINLSLVALWSQSFGAPLSAACFSEPAELSPLKAQITLLLALALLLNILFHFYTKTVSGGTHKALFKTQAFIPLFVRRE